MAVDHIRYDIMTQDALRGVVRQVLTDAAKKGLPGEHHFFITFDTKAPGVRLSARMREQYPEEMTIVLQHQYWNLSVEDEGFSVTLRFHGKPERLVVPWSALRSFVDPSVAFGLRLSPAVDEAAPAGGPEKQEEHAATVAPFPPTASSLSESKKVVDFDSFRRKDDDREGA
jgi:hypothetical protein